MPTPKKGPRLGGSPSHQRLILSNLATALFEHGRITTTEARARTLRPVAEKLITKAKKAEETEVVDAPTEMTEEASPEESVVAEAEPVEDEDTEDTDKA